MSKKYGPIIGLKLGMKNAVVLHDAGLVQDLIIKQGSSMASRPPRYVSQERVMPEGKHIHPVFMRDDWAMKLRAITKDYMVGRGLLDLVPMAKAIGMRLVDAIHHSNGDWSDDLAEWALEVQTSQLTGAPVELFGRKYVHEYHEMTVALEDIMVSRAADIIPILRWVPAMFAEWKRRAPVVRKQVLDAYTQLVTVTKTHHAGSYKGLIPKLLSQSVDPATEPSHRMTEMEITMMMGGLLYAYVSPSR
jgi:Cytochrome P450